MATSPARRVRTTSPVRWVWAYLNGPAPHYAPAIAFNAFVALFPILLGLIALLVLMAPGRVVFVQVERTLREALPVGSQTDIRGLLRTINTHARSLGLISLLGMAWAGSALFACLGGALNAINDTPGRHVVWQRLMGLRLNLVLILSIAALVLLEDLTDVFVRSTLTALVPAWLVLVFLLLFIYTVAPNRSPGIRASLPGAAIGAALILGVSFGVHRVSLLVEASSSYGQGIALSLAFLTWLYLVSHAILLGAFFNRTRHLGRR